MNPALLEDILLHAQEVSRRWRQDQINYKIHWTAETMYYDLQDLCEGIEGLVGYIKEIQNEQSI